MLHSSLRPLLFLTVLTLLLPGTVAAQSPAFDWAGLDRSLTGYADKSNFLVAEFRGSGCSTIHEHNADLRLGVASVFKLYVLGELARQVQIGAVHWDDQVPLQADLRSMPTGDYAFVPVGTKVSVQDLAAAMIQHSDNTATDHLIALLGRDNVLNAFKVFGHGDPSLNAPLLMTHELFAMKMTQTPEWIANWETLDDEEQMQLVESVIGPIQIDPGGGWGRWNGPTAIDRVEWFASANELCAVTSSLWSMGAQPGLEPVRQILADSRGGVGSQATLPSVGYKGGYEAGVVNMTFVLARTDGRVFFVSAGLNDYQDSLDFGPGRVVIDQVFACLARLDDDTCTT